jgi:multidrug resistance efflux pump
MAFVEIGRLFRGIGNPQTRFAGGGATAIPIRRLAKLAAGIALLTVAALTVYEHVVVRVSREAVINARIVSIRAPIDGVVTAAVGAPGAMVRAGVAISQLQDTVADDTRVFQLEGDLNATDREREAASRRLADLERARAEASAQADAYRLGRVRQVELRIEETRASLAVDKAKEAEAIAAERRGNALRTHGYMAQATYENLVHAREVAQQQAIATQKRIDTLTVELEAARNGTYLGDNYNDVPSSFQRARELSVRIDETKATLDQLTQKTSTLATQLAAERGRLQARSTAALTSPIDGNLWTVQAAAGEYVRKGQELFTIVDCATVVVTASVSERDYNELRLGEPVWFRVSGTGREYSGRIAKLGLTSTGRSFAIAPEERRHQVAVQLADLGQSTGDSCAVGRSGEVIFEGSGHGFAARLVETARQFLGLA